MLPCLVNSRPHLRHSSQSLGLLPLSPHILTSLLLYLRFRSSRDEKPVTASPLESALTNCDARNPFRIRFYENHRVSPATSSLFSLFAQRVIHKSCAFKRLRTLSKNSRVYPNSAHSGTRFRASQEIGFPSPHPIKSPHRPHNERKRTSQDEATS